MESNGLWSIGQYVFPICEAKVVGQQAEIGRFLGTGFWVSDDGFFATCKHVIEAVPEGKVPLIGQPYSVEQDTYTLIRAICCHSRYDIAIGIVKKKTKHLTPYPGMIGMGLKVQAFGFSDSGKRGGSYRVDTRLLMGHVSCISEDSGDFPSSSLLEVSFAAPSGYSGAPLLVDDRITGMIYGNTESTLDEYRREEISDNGEKYVEVRHRFIEYGLAHPWVTIQESIDEFRQQLKDLSGL